MTDHLKYLLEQARAEIKGTEGNSCHLVVPKPFFFEMLIAILAGMNHTGTEQSAPLLLEMVENFSIRPFQDLPFCQEVIRLLALPEKDQDINIADFFQEGGENA